MAAVSDSVSSAGHSFQKYSSSPEMGVDRGFQQIRKIFIFFFGHFIALHIETLSFFCEWSGLLVQIWRSHWIVVSQARSVTHLVKEPLSTDEKEGARSKARVSSTSPTSAAVAVPVRRQWDERIHYSAHPHGDPKELHPFPSLLSSLWFLLLMSFPLFSTFWLMIQWLFVHVTWVKT